MNVILDTSVLTRLSRTRPEVRDAVHAMRAEADLFGRTTITDLELSLSARNAMQWEALRIVLDQFDEVEIGSTHVSIAKSLQRDLADAGRAGRKVADLLIAAAAIDLGATLVHYDRAFEHIAQVSNLDHQWIVPAGSVD